ncbi:MAG: Holliday junction branch migration protein RuvA [Myxococcota bacterium]
MIGRLTGRIVDLALDGSIVLDVAGVGYEVFVPSGSVGIAELEGEHAATTLHIHTHVREEAITLYGFAHPMDKAAFRALLGVSSVGPKLALSILSRLPAFQLADAVAQGNRLAFNGISGVGKKTRERLLLDLKDKLPKVLVEHVVTAPQPSPVHEHASDRELAQEERTVLSALIQMGYRSVEAERALDAIRPTQGRAVQELLRDALRALG